MPPQHVDGGGGGDGLKTGQAAGLGEAAVGADGERGADLMPAVGCVVAHAAHDLVLLGELADVGAHDQLEGGVAGGLGGEELQELRLGHQRDVGEAAGQAGQVDGDRRAGRQGRLAELAVGQLKQLVREAKLVQDLHDRGVQRVAAEVAVEVAVGFQQHHRHALAGQQQREHRAGRPGTHDAAGGLPHRAQLTRLGCPGARAGRGRLIGRGVHGGLLGAGRCCWQGARPGRGHVAVVWR